MTRPFVILSLVLAAGCQRSTEVPAPVDPSERVISLMPSATEFVYALGAEGALVGRSTHCDYPLDVQDVPSVGTGLDPDLEAIMALDPTLVLASGAQSGLDVLEPLRASGVDVLLLPDASVDSALSAPALLGTRLGRAAEAEALALEMRAALDATPRTGEGERVLIFVGHSPFFVAGADTFVGGLLELSGAENAAPSGWSAVDREFILVAAPTAIIDATGADTTTWSGLEDVPAIAAGRTCPIDPDVVSRPGPRIGEAAQAFSRCLE